jgi:hypothetical protein
MKTRKPPSAPVFEEPPLSGSFSEAALAPLFELNAFFLDVLAEAARDPSHKGWAWEAALRPELLQLTPAARAGIARCPVCLVDAGFQDEGRWASIASAAEVSESAATDGLPPGRAVELTQMTVTLAWSVARANAEAACIIFGMTRRCARVVAGLSVHRIPALAERNSPQIRPAWADDSEIWGRLLNLSKPVPTSRLPPLHVRAMQRQLAELSLATTASQPIR